MASQGPPNSQGGPQGLGDLPSPPVAPGSLDDFKRIQERERERRRREQERKRREDQLAERGRREVAEREAEEQRRAEEEQRQREQQEAEDQRAADAALERVEERERERQEAQEREIQERRRREEEERAAEEQRAIDAALERVEEREEDHAQLQEQQTVARHDREEGQAREREAAEQRAQETASREQLAAFVQQVEDMALRVQLPRTAATARRIGDKLENGQRLTDSDVEFLLNLVEPDESGNGLQLSPVLGSGALLPVAAGTGRVGLVLALLAIGAMTALQAQRLDISLKDLQIPEGLRAPDTGAIPEGIEPRTAVAQPQPIEPSQPVSIPPSLQAPLQGDIPAGLQAPDAGQLPAGFHVPEGTGAIAGAGLAERRVRDAIEDGVAPAPEAINEAERIIREARLAQQRARDRAADARVEAGESDDPAARARLAAEAVTAAEAAEELGDLLDDLREQVRQASLQVAQAAAQTPVGSTGPGTITPRMAPALPNIGPGDDRDKADQAIEQQPGQLVTPDAGTDLTPGTARPGIDTGTITEPAPSHVDQDSVPRTTPRARIGDITQPAPDIDDQPEPQPEPTTAGQPSPDVSGDAIAEPSDTGVDEATDTAVDTSADVDDDDEPTRTTDRDLTNAATGTPGGSPRLPEQRRPEITVPLTLPGGLFPRKVQWRDGDTYFIADLVFGTVRKSAVPAPGGVEPGPAPEQNVKVIELSQLEPIFRKVDIGETVVRVEDRGFSFTPDMGQPAIRLLPPAGAVSTGAVMRPPSGAAMPSGFRAPAQMSVGAAINSPSGPRPAPSVMRLRPPGEISIHDVADASMEAEQDISVGDFGYEVTVGDVTDASVSDSEAALEETTVDDVSDSSVESVTDTEVKSDDVGAPGANDSITRTFGDVVENMATLGGTLPPGEAQQRSPVRGKRPLPARRVPVTMPEAEPEQDEAGLLQRRRAAANRLIGDEESRRRGLL